MSAHFALIFVGEHLIQVDNVGEIQAFQKINHQEEFTISENKSLEASLPRPGIVDRQRSE